MAGGVDNRAGLDREALEAIEAATRSHRTLEDVTRWGLLHRPALLVAGIVTQDEYTHDVLLPYRDVWLVYDTT